MQISYSIYSLPPNQKYNPNTINNTQNDKKPVSNAVLYNLETYKEQHNYFIGHKLTNPTRTSVTVWVIQLRFPFMEGKAVKWR